MEVEGIELALAFGKHDIYVSAVVVIVTAIHSAKPFCILFVFSD